MGAPTSRPRHADFSGSATSGSGPTGAPKGQAERFILTMLNESQYAAVYRDSAQRSSALQAWVERYNEAKTRREPGRQAPITRLRQSLNNVLGAHN